MEKMLSKKQVAELLGLSIYTIDKWIYLNKNLPYVKCGGRTLFKMEDIRDFVQKNRNEPESE